MLAFSRRQPLEPQVLDIRTVINGMQEMLVRTLGETISLEVVGGAGLWRCEADPNQLENVLLNLAINARDAMEKGGKLTIETGNAFLDDAYAASHPGVIPGQYVMLAVSDTGSGMTEDVKRQVFEPFFTTKAPGKGNGLGLSMAFGFIRQSGGYIEIYSELEGGTTVKVYLPRSTSKLIQEPVEVTTEEPQGSGETILLVEDDEGVRELVKNSLKHLGYEVVTAVNSTEALQALDSSPEVALILTDVVLPGANGAELARQARTLRADLKVMYMSGYTENAIVHDGKLDPGVQLLQKPFTRLQLAQKLHQTLRF